MQTFQIGDLHGKYLEFATNQSPFLDIILIHPFPLSWQYYERTFQHINLLQLAVKKGRIRVFFPDLPGFGQSKLPDSTLQDLSAYVQAIEQLISHFTCTNVIIGGCSMGGYVSLEFIRTHDVKGLVLLDTRSGADTNDGKAGRIATAEHFISVQQGDLSLGELNNEFVDNFQENMITKLLSPHTISSSPGIVTEIKSLMAQQHPRAVANALFAMAGRGDTTNALANFSKPVLIVVGEDDLLTNVTQAELMHTTAQQSELHIIPKAGHLASLEAVEIFSHIFTRWLIDNF